MKLRTLLIIVVLAVVLPWPAGAVTREELVCPLREDWGEKVWEQSEKEETELKRIWSAACPCEEKWKPTEKQLQEILTAHIEWLSNFGGAPKLSRDGPLELTTGRQAVLCNADLVGANLQEADLMFAYLMKADLTEAKLQKANLQGAELREANLQGADLREADLRGADLREAYLLRADLQEADLGAANLQKANLVVTDLRDARLSDAKLGGAIYAPASPPPNPYVEHITGLNLVVIPYDHDTRTTQVSGMVQLRKLLQEAGLRDQERQTTFAIEHHKARHMRCDLREVDYPYKLPQDSPFGTYSLEEAKRVCQQKGSVLSRLGGWLQLIFFEWTTGWGLYPGRALLLALGLMVGMTVVYVFPITILPYHLGARSGIYRIWPRDRLDPASEETGIAGTAYAERLTAGFPAALGWAFYFSMISAFHIGWRDLNVGTWISRIQPSEFALRGRGWVRVVSGTQSLISVYLVAMWVLTYFGRPFQ